jgi:hypothetical protein
MSFQPVFVQFGKSESIQDGTYAKLTLKTIGDTELKTSIFALYC